MCTLSWMMQPGSYALVFNRDERKTRLRAEPPAHRTDAGGNRFIAPIDRDAGGSWLMANEFGITACLLNVYGEKADDKQSRGNLPLLFSGCPALEEADSIMTQVDPENYNGFCLVLFEAGKQPLQYHWDRKRLTKPETGPMLTSSSFQSRDVCAFRQTLFEQMAPTDLNALLEFQNSREADHPAFPPCMNRDDAQTVSQCVVEIGPDRISLRYADGSPAEVPLSSPLILERTAEPCTA